MKSCWNKLGATFVAALILALPSAAQSVADYYSAATGQNGAALKTALADIIGDHEVRSYAQLWTDFRQTDARADGKVWDMYSSITNFTFGTDQAGNYSAEGDVYNREHSFPKSWFNDASPMYSDLFHIVPTDGYVNNRRSNLPYGETSAPTYSSSGGWSRVGPSSVAGYTGDVFEPNDEYKGDFARIYFYMATCYEGRIASWSSPMLAGNAYPAFASWALDMLLRWATDDPVSEKERARNESVYTIQGNRNPFVDFPGLEQYVWGCATSQAFDPSNYAEPSIVPAAPDFLPASGSMVALGENVTIGSNVSGTTICYSVNEGEWQMGTAPVSVAIVEATTITAYAQRGDVAGPEATATYTVRAGSVSGDGVYVLVTSASQLTDGGQYLFVCEAEEVAMSQTVSDRYRTYSPVSITQQHTFQAETNGEGEPTSFTLRQSAASDDCWAFCDYATGLYLALLSSDNRLHTAADMTLPTAAWTISIGADGTAHVANASYTAYSVQYNASSPRFACYRSTQTPEPIRNRPSIYSKKESQD